MRRVTKANPCSVCKKDSWCLVGKSLCICMRIQSEKPKNFRGGEVGWIHPLDGNALPTPYVKPTPLPVINVSQIIRGWALNTTRRAVSNLASTLRVSCDSLYQLQFVQTDSDREFGIPMRDGYGNYTGIRIRHESGSKWAVPGSHAGIFIPNLQPQSTSLILEGPTDTAAALTMGYYGLGRPSCSGGVPHLVTAVQRLKIQRVVIVADNDDPGIRGAQDLQRWLPVPSCILVLPTKDLREAVKSGIDKSTIDSMIEQLVWTQPKEKQ